jgi:hypothetical protein
MDSVLVSATATVGILELSDATVIYCRNTVCTNGAFSTIGSNEQTAYVELIATTFTVNVDAESHDGSSTSLTFGYVSGNGDAPFRNGDRYDVSLLSAAGDVVLAGSGAAQYSTVSDDSTFCGSPSCTNASITL